MSVIQKLVLSFLALALGPVLLIAPLIYFSISQTLAQQAHQRLESVAIIQADWAQKVVNHNRDRLTTLTLKPELASGLDRLSRGPASSDRARLNELLLATKSQSDSYTTVVVADPNGAVVSATDPARLGQSVAAQAAFQTGRQRADVSNHFFTLPSGQDGLYLTAPVKHQGRLVGVVLIESNAAGFATAVQNHAGLGTSGEVVLLKQNQSPDYQANAVLAVTRPIEGTNWHLVVKMDQSEAYAPLAGLRDTFLILIFVVLVIAVFAALFVARSTIDPVITLARAAELMSKGDLSQRVPVTSKDELGSLATAFNNMAGGLEKIDLAKSEFITLMSHQLRTPATAVKGFMAMVLDGYAGKLTAKQNKLLQAAYHENERQMRIVDDILLVEAANTNQMGLIKAPTNLTSLITEAVAAQDGIFREHEQKIIVSQPKGSIMLTLDEEKIRMVLENLINNASKYSPDQTEIRVTVKRENRGAAISITDQGFGIAPADISKLFQRFSRLPNPNTTQAQGSGLGLYLVKKIIQLHEGDITITSEVGKGTTITVHLPGPGHSLSPVSVAQASPVPPGTS